MQRYLSPAILSRLLPWLLLLVLAGLLGSSFSVLKQAVATYPVFSVNFWRLLLAGLAILTLRLLLPGKIKVQKRDLIHLIGVAFFGNSFAFSLLGLGELYINSNIAAIIMGIQPGLLLLYTICVSGQRFSLLAWLGIGVGFCGILLLIFEDGLFTGQTWWPGYYLVLAAATCFAIATKFAENIKGNDLFINAAIIMLVAALAMLLPALVKDGSIIINPAPVLAQIVYLGLIATGLPVLLFLTLVRLRGAIFTSLVSYLIPVFGYVFGWVLLGEALFWYSNLAILIIIVASVICDRQLVTVSAANGKSQP